MSKCANCGIYCGTFLDTIEPKWIETCWSCKIKEDRKRTKKTKKTKVGFNCCLCKKMFANQDVFASHFVQLNGEYVCPSQINAKRPVRESEKPPGLGVRLLDI